MKMKKESTIPAPVALWPGFLGPDVGIVVTWHQWSLWTVFFGPDDQVTLAFVEKRAQYSIFTLLKVRFLLAGCQIRASCARWHGLWPREGVLKGIGFKFREDWMDSSKDESSPAGDSAVDMDHLPTFKTSNLDTGMR